jgi:heme exporter protein C
MLCWNKGVIEFWTLKRDLPRWTWNFTKDKPLHNILHIKYKWRDYMNLRRGLDFKKHGRDNDLMGYMDSAIRTAPFVPTANARSQTTRAIGFAAACLLAVALVLVFIIAPPGALRSGGQAFRIFYFHFPSAIVGFSAWLVTAYCAIRYLKTRDLKWDRIAVSSAEIGVMFIVLVLLSGMLWARPTWNAWWTWDFKLTISLLQFLMYLAYLVLRSGVDNPDQRARFAAVYAIVGALTVPLNFLVSRVLQSIHPAVIGPSVNAAQQGGFGIASDIVPILLFSTATFFLIYVYFLRRRLEFQERSDWLAFKRAEFMAERD